MIPICVLDTELACTLQSAKQKNNPCVCRKYLVNFQSLQTQGFTVIKDFLLREHIHDLLLNYNYARQNPSAAFHEIGVAEGQSHGLQNLFEKTLHQIREQTNITANFCYPYPEFFNPNNVQYSYHQDYEAYWLWQNTYQCLNFWIPLVKNTAKEDGLKIIPMDRLGEYLSFFYGKGATTCTPSARGGTFVTQDCTATSFHMPFKFDDLAIVPEVVPGDALVFREDVIHASQPKINYRVAASIKCVDTRAVISRSFAYSWANNLWKSTCAKSVLNFEYLHKLDKAFDTKDLVLVEDIVLTEKKTNARPESKSMVAQ